MRLRITATAAAIMTVVLAVAGIAVVLIVQRQVVSNFDRSLAQRADLLAATAVDDPAALPMSNDEDRFVQFVDRNGDVIASTVDVDTLLAELPADGGRQAFATSSNLPIEDDAYRLLAQRVEGDGAVRYIIVGENIDDLDHGVRALVTTLGIVFPLAVIALAGVVWWLVGRTLGAVEEIRREVAGIGLTELDRRVPVPPTGDEIGLLAGTMNDMLARLESASANQRRFVADVSHEMRTPLTRIRTTLEVDLSGGDADLEQTCRDVLGDAIDMQALIDDLLFLARHDAGSTVLRQEPVDLDVIVEGEVARMRADGTSDVQIDTSDVGAVEVIGDDRQLARVVRNLVSNALRHARSQVKVSLHHDADAAILVVDDDGPGVPSHERDRVFERFVRLDAARSAKDGGTGLGLAIVRDIVVAHGGSVVVDEAPIGGARFEVHL